MGRGPAWWTRPLHVSALPIFPGRRQPSIFGADELNFCVRDGNRWTLIAINTDFVFSPPGRFRRRLEKGPLYFNRCLG